MKHRLLATFSGFALTAVTLAASGSGAVAETPDAGQTLATALVATGPTVVGELMTHSDVDIYRISISNPAAFSASTVGGTTIDTMLTLFDLQGHVVEFNNDFGVEGASSQSTLPASQQNPYAPTTAGDYYLAISSYGYEPWTSGDQEMTYLNHSWASGSGDVFGPEDPTWILDHWAELSYTGTTYGAYTITLTGVAGPGAPANDRIGGATVVGSLPYTDSSSTVNATLTGDPTDCMTGPAIWYRYTPSTATGVQADTSGSDFDTMLAVYQGKPGSRSTAVACDDNAGSNSTSLVALNLNPKYTYYFMVGGAYTNATGNAVFNLAVEDAVPVVTISARATVTAAGVVTVSGSVVCGSGTDGTLTDVWLVQSFRDGTSAYGDGPLSVACSVDATTFSATATSNSGTPFARGTVWLDFYGEYVTADYAGISIDKYLTVRMAGAK